MWIPEATVATFYGIHPNVPGEGISLPASMSSRFFIHDTSQGARCLKKGTVVLYNCGVDDSRRNISYMYSLFAGYDFDEEEDNECESKVDVQ